MRHQVVKGFTPCWLWRQRSKRRSGATPGRRSSLDPTMSPRRMQARCPLTPRLISECESPREVFHRSLRCEFPAKQAGAQVAQCRIAVGKGVMSRNVVRSRSHRARLHYQPAAAQVTIQPPRRRAPDDWSQPDTVRFPWPLPSLPEPRDHSEASQAGRHRHVRS